MSETCSNDKNTKIIIYNTKTDEIEILEGDIVEPNLGISPILLPEESRVNDLLDHAPFVVWG